MSERKETVRHGFAVAGVVTGLLAGGLVVLSGGLETTGERAMILWLAVAGGALFVAGVRERFPLGVVTVGWPRVAAFGLALLALGSSVIGFTQLFTGPSGLGILNVVVALFVAMYVGVVALECLLGGVRMDEETFVVE
ncbi:hypothetical protein EA462_14735 [Natrarchaeobius halalkaliphilus]|uniref:DUF2975 domain-containing protein n=1 Tax=Natrarchaeobius halalkaliphilus TaxID=1679091 RepID=A0A3N6MRM2_9EURY|nr:hypothetical protein [Natrarchaeobius halalkaliphilus]RQG86913.1 hypothetical protein EA462_14735 [Natrarchaeobius halalkaliphilus]